MKKAERLLVLTFFVFSLAPLAQDLPPDLYQTTVTVVGDRLSDEQEDLAFVPGSVTVITAKDIEQSSARSLQELIAESGLHIQVQDINGNGRTLGLQIRGHQGFKGGVLLIVDGVRMNTPDSNQADFASIDLENVERVEILRGAQGATYGGDMASGVVRVITKRNRSLPILKAEVKTGSRDTYGAKLHLSGRKGKVDGRVDLNWSESDGYRHNGGFEEGRASLGLNVRASKHHDWGISLYHNNDSYQIPGALERSDYLLDPWQNPYNQPDFSDRDLTRGVVRYKFSKNAFQLSALGSFSTENGESLTTGRSAWSLGGSGILSDISRQHKSLALEGRHNFNSTSWTHRFTWGGEWNRYDFAALSLHTDTAGEVIAAPGGMFGFPRPDDTRRGWTDTDETMTGLFLGYHGDGEVWTVDAALRHDRVSFNFHDLLGYEYIDFFTFTTVDVPPFQLSRDFSRWSGHFGVTLHPGLNHTLFARVGQAWLVPSIQQLFAFPDFGSNPDLEPVRVRDLEIGYRYAGPRGTFQAALFETRMRGEIYFDAFDFLNKNLGETRRRGLEIDGRLLLNEEWSLRGGLQFLDADITEDDGSGILVGMEVPLVADFSGSLGLHFDNRTVNGYLQLRHSGSRYMASDTDNSSPRLGSRTLLEGGVEWHFHHQGSIRLEVHNLLDEDYSSWGVEFYDFLTWDPTANAFTPGEPVHAELSFRWQF